MFDKFIESGSDADQNSRRSYFLVSTIVVGILFVTGVIASIYAQEIGLGTDEFELSSILAPVVPETPEPPQPERERPQDNADSPEKIVRQANILRPEESPIIPTTTSVVPNTQAVRPNAPFEIGRFDTPPTSYLPAGPAGPVAALGPGTPSGSSQQDVLEPERTVEPPPAIKPKPKPVISRGPVNGYATSLPKPAYPAVARAINLTGDVSVQVLIDESGSVVSARVVSGHQFFRQEAERAAWKAKFKPTYLADVPVKVTGVITYKFSK